MARIVWRPYDYVREDEVILDNVNDGKSMEACDLYKNENHNGDKTNGVSKNHKGWKRLYEILWLNTTLKAIVLVLYNIYILMHEFLITLEYLIEYGEKNWWSLP